MHPDELQKKLDAIEHSDTGSRLELLRAQIEIEKLRQLREITLQLAEIEKPLRVGLPVELVA